MHARRLDARGRRRPLVKGAPVAEYIQVPAGQVRPHLGQEVRRVVLVEGAHLQDDHSPQRAHRRHVEGQFRLARRG